MIKHYRNIYISIISCKRKEEQKKIMTELLAQTIDTIILRGLSTEELKHMQSEGNHYLLIFLWSFSQLFLVKCFIPEMFNSFCNVLWKISIFDVSCICMITIFVLLEKGKQIDKTCTVISKNCYIHIFMIVFKISEKRHCLT